MLEKHSASITGHRTSFSIEPEFWAELKRIAAERGEKVAAIIARLDKGEGNLSSKIRVWVLKNK